MQQKPAALSGFGRQVPEVNPGRSPRVDPGLEVARGQDPLTFLEQRADDRRH